MKTITFFTTEELEGVKKLFPKLDSYNDWFIEAITWKDRISKLDTDDLVKISKVLTLSTSSEVSELHYFQSSKNFLSNSILEDENRIEDKKNEIKRLQKNIRETKKRQKILSESKNLEEFFTKLLVTYQ